MSGKLLGIGIVSIGCMAGAAVGGYFVLHQGEAEITTVAPISVPAEAPPIQPATPPAPIVTPAAPASAPKARTPEPIRPKSPVLTAPVPSAPVQDPVVDPAQTAPPVVPPVTPVTPVAAEAQRYVPDPLPVTAAVQEPPRIQFEELTVEKHSVIGIRLDEAISTRTARVEDRVSATVSRDVTVAGRIAIPTCP